MRYKKIKLSSYNIYEKSLVYLDWLFFIYEFIESKCLYPAVYNGNQITWLTIPSVLFVKLSKLLDFSIMISIINLYNIDYTYSHYLLII